MDDTTDGGPDGRTAVSVQDVPAAGEFGIPGLADAVEIGRGGFATVFRAQQTEFNRPVAAKVLAVELDETARLRFQRECQALGSLSDHRGIVPVYTAGVTADGRPYLLMPYLSGGSYDTVLRDGGPLGWAEVTDVGVRLAEALSAAHAQGILHRDIKPANIMRSRHGTPLLGDFGIARVSGSAKTTSAGGTLTGSVHYMAPELIDGYEPAVSSDVYALGATLYALLSGRPPFERDSDHSIVPVLNRIISATPEPLEGVPTPVMDVIRSAMAKSALERYADAAALGMALQDAQRACGIAVTAAELESTASAPLQPVVTPVIPPVEPAVGAGLHGPRTDDPPLGIVSDDRDTRSQPRRRGAAVIGVIAVTVLAVVAGVVLLTRGGDEDAAAGFAPATATVVLTGGEELSDDTIDQLPLDEATVMALEDGEAEAYAIDVAAGQYLRVRMAAQEETIDPFLTLLDPDGQVLLQQDDNAGGLNQHDALVDWVFADSGVHVVVASAYSLGQAGTAELSASLADPEPLHVDQEIGADIGGPFDVASYALDVEDGQVFHVNAYATDFNVAIGVLTPSGEVLTDDGADGTDAVLYFDDAEPGTYGLFVFAEDNESHGSFTLAVASG